MNEAPGSYLWHDHSAIYRADGLQGALIVRPKRSSAGSKQKSQEVAKQPLMNYDAEHTLFLMDWWHFTGNAMAMRLNRWGLDTVVVVQTCVLPALATAIHTTCVCKLSTGLQ